MGTIESGFGTTSLSDHGCRQSWRRRARTLLAMQFFNDGGLAATVTLDYQFIVNPAYNRDRGFSCGLGGVRFGEGND
jgi:hypothetical protein